MTGHKTQPAAELGELAQRLGASVVSAELISPLRRSDHHRAAFCVALSDGRRVKLRRMVDAATTQRLEQLLAILRPAGLPRVLARLESSLVLEWVPGEGLAKQPITRARIVQAGRLLGEIHRAGSLARQPSEVDAADSRLEVGSSRDRVAAELERSREQLDELVSSQRLERSEADVLLERLHESLHAGTTNTLEQGIVHGDFAPENLVLDEDGALRVVDNESVQLGFLDLDVARVWARWPMPADDWQSFLDAYSAQAHRSCSDALLIGWKIRALLVSAWYRTAFELAGASTASEALRHFAASRGWTRIHPEAPGAEAP